MAERSFAIGKVIAPWRFLLFLGVLAAGAAVAIPFLTIGRGFMVGFDLASVVFLVSALPLLNERETDQMRDRSERNDANRALLLLITVITTLAILAAVTREIGQKQPNALNIALVTGTLILSWFFSNVMYALHYAHLYYARTHGGADQGGLEFPDCDMPGYWDFLYFSFTLGMTFQTSDVQISSQQLRRTVIGQSLAAFIFNLGVLAFTINTLGSATGGSR